jgi:ribonuclease VapC
VDRRTFLDASPRSPAALNFGDCLTYAVARLAGRPLLCTGRADAKTDLTLA